MKKICIITSTASTAKLFFLDFLIYMNKNSDYEITIICSEDKEFSDALPSFITYIPVNMKRGVHISGIIATYKLYKIFKKNKYDIVQYSTPNAAFYSSIAAKLAKIKVRLYCQLGIIYVGYKGIKRIVFKKIEKITSRLSTIIEPVSVDNLKFGRLEKLYDDSKSRVIWNGSSSGVNLNKFDINHKNEWKKEVFEKYNIPFNSFVYGYVGRIHKDKGINELLKAFKLISENHDNVFLLIIGAYDKFKGLDKKLFNWANKQKNIIFCGFSNEVEKYFSSMDIFVLPSYREGFGSVVIEAQAMGVPVITTDIPGPRDAIINNVTGFLVKKRDYYDLYVTMLKLYQSDLNIIVGLEGRNHVEKNFEQLQLFQYTLEDRRLLID